MPVKAGLALDLTQRIVNVHWGGVCRFAVCGYDGNFQGEGSLAMPVYFGVGAYSDNGKSWTTFTVFPNGSTASIFHMPDPVNSDNNIVLVGGSLNEEAEGSTSSTAILTTIVGESSTDTGGSSRGRNVANFGSIGYDTKLKRLYAVENSGEGAGEQIIHEYEIGIPNASPPSPSDEPTLVWAGPHYPGLEPVIDCSIGGGASEMKIKDKDGNTLTLSFTSEGMLHLDDLDITPPSADSVRSAAGGMNDLGEIIIIAVGYYEDEEEKARAAAWWSIKGEGWIKIEGIWSEGGEPDLQAAQMATAATI